MARMLLWFTAVFFYGYEFILRVSPNVLLQEWSQAYSMTQYELGHLSAYYHYAYALFQIPAGLLLDKYPYHRIFPFAIALTALGTWMMSVAPQLEALYLARIFIGIGSAFAFIAACKIAAEAFGAKHFPVFVGLTNFAGVMGAILGGAPLAHALNLVSWQSLHQHFALIGFVLAILFFIQAYSLKPVQRPSSPPLKETLKQLMGSSQTWLLALYGCLVMVPITAFSEVWSIAFFEKAYGYSRTLSASANTCVFLGIALGGPLIGYLFEHCQYTKRFLRLCLLTALMLFSIILWVPNQSLSQVFIFLFLYGAATSHMLLCFSLIKAWHPHLHTGIVIGFSNMLIVACSALFHPLIGKSLDTRIGPPKLDGLPSLEALDYQLSLSVLIAGLILAYVLSYFIKEPAHASRPR